MSRRCRYCEGSGFVIAFQVKCYDCKGAGYLKEKYFLGYWIWVPDKDVPPSRHSIRCPKCDGRGQEDVWRECLECDGYGYTD